MQTKTFALFALTASSVLASPFHKRQESAHHHHHHGTGQLSGVHPSGTAAGFQHGNDTSGFFAPTAASNAQFSTLILTKTVSPIPADSGVNTVGKVVSSSSSCTTTSIVTETSTNFITVTASPSANTKAIEANGNSISAGAFYGGGQGSRSFGGFGQSQSAPAAPTNAIATSASATTKPAVANPSTTFATSVKSSASSASASVPSSGGSSGSGSKRGISFNDASLVSAFSGKVSWAYNWGATASGLSGVEFVPMCWGKDAVSSFAGSVGSATHVLSFNEPDLNTQSNMNPSTAASLHKQVFSGLKGKVQIGSPAVTNGDKAADGSPMGVNWLDEFFTACGAGCPVDFVAYHWYATADSFSYFKQHTEDIIAVAAKHGVSKVWLTEFAPEGSADAQSSFMAQAVPYLDSNSSVERYAAFMASDATLLSGNSLNSVGKAYVAA